MSISCVIYTVKFDHVWMQGEWMTLWYVAKYTGPCLIWPAAVEFAPIRSNGFGDIEFVLDARGDGARPLGPECDWLGIWGMAKMRPRAMTCWCILWQPTILIWNS